MNDFSPYPKSKQLAGHQKEKNLPKFTNKRPKKRKKRNPLKPEIYKGRRIPKKSVRGRVLRQEYNKAALEHGFECFFCGSTHDLECHHVMPRGFSKHKEGRGKYRNLRFLCNECHTGENGVHRNKEKLEQLQAEHERLYGEWYWADEYDLFKAGLIPNTTTDAYETFMQEEEERMRDEKNAQ